MAIRAPDGAKNGFKHPMLAISMVDNVISYKKNFFWNVQKNKIADFTM